MPELATNATSSTQPPITPAGRQTLTQDFDTFLTLLTTQLQNQDPLSPLDTNEFTGQLVQFSGVEQQIRTNETLESLVSISRLSQASAASVYLGRDAVIDSPITRAENGVARFDYSLASAADSSVLRVRDSLGRVVFEGAGATAAGSRGFSFETADAIGRAGDPDGLYTLEVAALRGNEAVSTDVNARVRVTGIDLSATEPTVVTALGPVPLAEIIRVDEPGTASRN